MIKETPQNIVLVVPPNKKYIVRDYYCTFSSKTVYNWPSQDLVMFSRYPGINMFYEDYSAYASIEDAAEVLKIYLEKNKLNSTKTSIIISTGSSVIDSDHSFCMYIKNNFYCGNIFLSSFFFNYYDDEVLSKELHGIDGFLRAPYKPFLEADAPILPSDNNFRLEHIPKHPIFLQSGKYWSPLIRNTCFSEITTSIGCRGNCSFCTTSGVSYITRDNDDLEKELAYISDLGVSDLLISDQDFLLPREGRERMLGIFKKYNMSWTAQSSAKNLVDISFTDLLKESGCYSLMIGVESLDLKTLEKYRKNITIDSIMRAFENCRKASINTLAFFIVPEDEEDFSNTYKKLPLLKADMASFSFLTGDHRNYSNKGAAFISLKTGDSSRLEIEDMGRREKYYSALLFRFYSDPGRLVRLIRLFIRNKHKLQFIRSAVIVLNAMIKKR